MLFTIRIEPEAYEDIQEGFDWYNEQQAGSGKKFHAAVNASFDKLQKNPFYQIRYDNVRCLPLQKYPYMIHFTVNETNTLVLVHAVMKTFRDPKNWIERR